MTDNSRWYFDYKVLVGPYRATSETVAFSVTVEAANYEEANVMANKMAWNAFKGSTVHDLKVVMVSGAYK